MDVDLLFKQFAFHLYVVPIGCCLLESLQVLYSKSQLGRFIIVYSLDKYVLPVFK